MSVNGRHRIVDQKISGVPKHTSEKMYAKGEKVEGIISHLARGALSFVSVSYLRDAGS